MKATLPLRPSRSHPPAASLPQRRWQAWLMTCVLTGAPLFAATPWNTPPLVVRPALFAQPLVWVADERRAQAEAPLLQECMDVLGSGDQEALLATLEEFLEADPDSPWAPSLRVNLGKHYSETGRYTRALVHWQIAWALTADYPEGAGKRIADYALAHWTRLLAQLGRFEAVDQLLAQTADRPITFSPLARMLSRTREAFELSRDNPGVAQKCGLFAVWNVALALGFEESLMEEILQLPEPLWSMKDIQAAALAQGVGLAAVERTAGDAFPVPSVVHLRLNHYVALLSRVDDVYEVADPSFGHNRLMSALALEEETSGACLVPGGLVPAGWRPLSDEESARFFGRGYTATFEDIGEQPCAATAGSCGGCPPGHQGPVGGLIEEPTQSAQPPGQISLGPKVGRADCGPNGCSRAIDRGLGMPVWQVSEPNINLWIYDRPLSYQPAVGQAVSFDLSYKQRDEETTLDDDVFAFGISWNSNWRSFINCYVYNNEITAQVYLPGGGKSVFFFATGVTEATSYDNNCKLTVTKSGSVITQFCLTYPSGQKLYYEFFRVDAYGFWYDVFLTRIVQPHGQTTTLAYPDYNPANLIVRLGTVTDADGRVTTLTYDQSVQDYPHLVSDLSAPYSLSCALAYNQYGQLTDITDAGGITSSLDYVYDTWDAPEISRLITPYGTNIFAFTQSEGPLARTMIVTEPNGGRQIFAFRYDSDWMTNAMPADKIPQGITGHTLDTTYPRYRNSFHWNQQQAQGLPGAVADFAANDYLRARRRHWLQKAVSSQFYEVSGTLSYEVAPSPDPGQSVEGQITWYDYAGKSLTYKPGTQIMPSTVAHRLGNETWYVKLQRNAWGMATSETSTWTQPNGTLATRTRNVNYDTEGLRVTGIFDYSGNLVRSNTYHSVHRQLETVREYPASGTAYLTTFLYEASTPYRLLAVYHPNGLTTTNTYYPATPLSENSRRLNTVTDLQLNRTRTYTWQGGEVRTLTDERGLVRTFTLDELGRVTRIDYSGTPATYEEFRYTSDGTATGPKILDMTYRRDRLGRITRFAYDGLRRATSMTDGRTNTTHYSYCGCGSPDSMTDPLQMTTSYSYDNAGRKTDVVYHDNTAEHFGYNLLGQMTSRYDTLGTTTYAYNNQGLLRTVSTSFGQVQQTLHDVEDRPSTVTDANGVSVTMTYDWLGRLRTRTYPDTGVEHFGYSTSLQSPTAYTNQLGEYTRYAYDAGGRKTNEVYYTAAGVATHTNRFTYNSAGDLLTLTDPKNQITQWQYDHLGRVTNKLDQASAQILRYLYDAEGQLTNRWSAAKGTTGYLYDAAGNLTKVDYPAGTTDITMAYDARNQLTNMVDAAGTTKYTYTALGELLTEDGPFTSDTVTYAYHASVPRLRSGLTLQQPSGSWNQTYGYDAAKRLSTVGGTAGTHTYTYRGAGTVWTNLALPNSSSVTNAYSSIGALTNTTLRTSGGTVRNRHSYRYNLAQRRDRQTRTDASTVDYTYDHLGQLIRALGSGGQSTENLGYGYDVAWNLNKRTNGVTVHTFTVDVKNQLVSTPYGTCTYDSNGNLTNDGAGRTFTYDAENQLTSVGWGGGNYRTDFVYDGRGRMRKRLDYYYSGGTWTVTGQSWYLYDGMRIVQERSGSNVPTTAYAWGQDLSGSFEGAGGIGGLLARSDQYSSGSWGRRVNAHADGNGNVTALIDSAQALIASYTYNPYGQLTASSGALASANKIRFSTKLWFDSINIYYYGYRFYDPNLQRWVNRDPLGEEGGFNLYAMVFNDPVNSYDAFGLQGKEGKPKPPKWDPGFWNTPANNNCCNYAYDRPGGWNNTPYNLQPGELGGMKPATKQSCDDIEKRVKADFPNDPNVGAPKDGKCPEGYHKIKPWVSADGWGFHMQRQDDDGKWSEKPGALGKAQRCNPNKPEQKGDKPCDEMCVPNAARY